MLHLNRKQGESVNIGDDIKVKVLQIKGNTVKLGFDAPEDVTILREEVPDRHIKRPPRRQMSP
jgi:carbon storage regulator